MHLFTTWLCLHWQEIWTLQRSGKRTTRCWWVSPSLFIVTVLPLLLLRIEHRGVLTFVVTVVGCSGWKTMDFPPPPSRHTPSTLPVPWATLSKLRTWTATGISTWYGLSWLGEKPGRPHCTLSESSPIHRGMSLL